MNRSSKNHWQNNAAKLVVLALIALLGVIWLNSQHFINQHAQAAQAGTTIIVNSTAQEATLAAPNGVANGDCTLGEAILSANSNTDVGGCVRAGSGAPFTIQLQAEQIYTLTARQNTLYGFTGLPYVTSQIVIQGNGAIIKRSSVAATPRFRLFTVAGAGDLSPTTNAVLTGGSLTLRQIWLRGGLAQGGGNVPQEQSFNTAGGGAGLGGAVYNRGTLNVEQSTLSANTAQGGAGGQVSVIGGGGGGGLGGASGVASVGGAGGGGFGGNSDIASIEGSGGGGTVGNSSRQTGGALNGGGGSDYGFETSGNGGAGGYGGGGGGSGYALGSNPVAGAGGAGGLGGGGGNGGSATSGFRNNTGISATGGAGGAGGFGGGGGGGNGANVFPNTGTRTRGAAGAGGFGGGNGGSGSFNGDPGGGGAGMGGAIFNDGGTLVLTNSTLSANTARGGDDGISGNGDQAGQGLGGAVFARNGQVTINHVTFAANTVAQGPGPAPSSAPTPEGGALYLLADGQTVYMDGARTTARPNSPITLGYSVSNTILADTTGTATDVFVNTINTGTITPGANANNLVEVNGASANALPGVIVTADPALGLLQINAPGLTPTQAITAGSPAHDAAACLAGITIDQRGVARFQGAPCDIGAYEVGECPYITAQVTGGTGSGAIRPGQSSTVTVIVAGGTTTYTITLSNNGGTQTGAGPVFNFSVTPSATTTYSIAAATDNNACPITAFGSATVTVDATPPTINCPANQTAVTAGTSTAVNYPAPTVNDNRTGATFICTPASGTTFPLGVTTVNCTATDAAGNTAQCSFTVTVRQPRPAIKNLINSVRTLAPTPLTQAQVNGLIGHLELANTNLERGQRAQACAYLQSFINAVNGLISGGRLTTGQGQPLLNEANKIRAAVGCS